MPSRVLKNKPLVEAILEVKWALKSPAPGVLIDPHYKILVGRLYDRVCGDYPESEQLPTATLPDEIVGQMVQHRFRTGRNDWPLLQIGPGILTLNDTHKYIWADFRARSVSAVRKLYEAHPKPAELEISSLMLRYIDAVDFDYSSNDLFRFLRDMLKVQVSLPDSLFTSQGVRREPSIFNWQSSFACKSPKGLVTVRFATGRKQNSPALLWETVVESKENETPSMPESFESWIDAAHAITDDWFFKFIEGELERRFNGG